MTYPDIRHWTKVEASFKSAFENNGVSFLECVTNCALQL